MAGYYCEFVTEPEDTLRCMICLGVAEDPLQHEACGRLFCRSCMHRHGENLPCPFCRRERPTYFNDIKSKREILSLRVKCENLERDCDWQGTIATLEDHAVVCPHALVPCPNQCKNNNIAVVLISRSDLNKHLQEDCPNRECSCKYCEEKGTYASIICHEKMCKRRIVSCLNSECGVAVQLQELMQHLISECQYTSIPCTYKRLGCEMVATRNSLCAHEEDINVHLPLMLQHLMKLEQRLMSMREELDTLKSLRFGRPYTFVLTNYKLKKESGDLFIMTPSFSTPDGYKMCVTVIGNETSDCTCGKSETNLAVVLFLLKGNRDNQLNWPLKGWITVSLLNQLEDSNHHRVKARVEVERPQEKEIRGGAMLEFVSETKLSLDRERNVQYLLDDMLYFSVHFEPEACKPWLRCTGHRGRTMQTT